MVGESRRRVGEVREGSGNVYGARRLQKRSALLCSQEMERESCSLQTKQFYLKKKIKNVIAVLKINPNLKLTVWSSLVHHNDFIFILSTGICFYCLLSSVKH